MVWRHHQERYSSQPVLNASFQEKTKPPMARRASKSLNVQKKPQSEVAQYVHSFKDAEVGGKPLFGAQQIPGADPTLRAADISFFR